MKKIIDDCYLPNDMFIKGYIRCAYSIVAPKYVLAEDMHFHDPRYKEAPASTKHKIITDRSGILCKFLKRVLKIRVGSRQDCEAHFEIDSGKCPAIQSTGCNACPRAV